MTRPTLHALAEAVGLAPTWRDYRGAAQVVSDEALRGVLKAMGHPADTAGALSASFARARADQLARPALITAVRGRPVALRGRPGKARLRLEDGGRRDVVLCDEGDGMVSLRAPRQIGYHHLDLEEGGVTLATAPSRALDVRALTGGRRAWGVAVQLYSLNAGGEFGDFGDLRDLVGQIATFGADAVAVSPTHALFTADPDRYAPYGPSTRLFLNPLYATAPRPSDRASTEALIDWRRGAEAKLARLRQAYAALDQGARAAFDGFVGRGGEPLLAHARFEALDARFRPRGVGRWRDWPGGYDDVRGAAVRALSPTDPEIEFHLFLQWRADLGASEAQSAAKAAGMAVGLISDLAVGVDGAGSHAWSHPDDILHGVSIGTPPDLLTRRGQSWGLTSFSPAALRTNGYAPFLATLRTVLRHAGGVRIDHAIGLRHLWISPEGSQASEGAYLAYPFEDLLRLIALESHRHGAIVIGEDLGTVPEGFRERSTRAGVAGMRVLWFERTAAGVFRAPSRWGRQAAAMTTTHDLPTVAGWWRGCDIACREQAGLEPRAKAAKADRILDAGRLWGAMVRSGAAKGAPPAPHHPDPVADAVVAHVAASDCDLALIAIEDVLGLVEQPNLPGGGDQHPNWRRRLPPGNGLDRPAAVARLKQLKKARA